MTKQQPWEIEYGKLQSAIVNICDYIKREHYSITEINQLSVSLMTAHKRVADALLVSEGETPNNYPDSLLDEATETYNSAHQLLISLRQCL